MQQEVHDLGTHRAPAGPCTAHAAPTGVRPVPYVSVALAPARSSTSTTCTWPCKMATARGGRLGIASCRVEGTGASTCAPALSQGPHSPRVPLAAGSLGRAAGVAGWDVGVGASSQEVFNGLCVAMVGGEGEGPKLPRGIGAMDSRRSLLPVVQAQVSTVCWQSSPTAVSRSRARTVAGVARRFQGDGGPCQEFRRPDDSADEVTNNE